MFEYVELEVDEIWERWWLGYGFCGLASRDPPGRG